MSSAQCLFTSYIMAPKKIPTDFAAVNEILTALNSQFTKLSREFTEVKNDITYIRAQLVEFNSYKLQVDETLKNNADEIAELKRQVGECKQKYSKLQDSIDDADAYERRDTVVLSGNTVPDVEIGENCSEIVKDLIREKLKLQISSADINTAHRIGRKPINQTRDKRSIIVKLCRRDTKRDVISASRRQSSSEKLYVNESLTPLRSKIMFTLRQMKRSHPDVVTGCSSFDGRVYAYTKPTGVQAASTRNLKHLVNTREMLVSFCSEYVKRPLENFLESWGTQQ